MKHCSLKFFTLLLLSMGFAACGGKKITHGEDPATINTQPSEQVRPEDMGPVAPTAQPNTSTDSAESVGPEPGPDYVPPKDGYVLVLGPGLARGMAYLGVLRELEEKHVSIRAVVGVEMGAVIAGVWGSTSLNGLEWEMHKFKRETLLDFPLIGKKVADGKKLQKFLDQALKINLLQKMKSPVLVASSSWNGENGNTLVESTGSAPDIIRGAMGIPGIVKPYEWEGVNRITAAIDQPFPVEQAKALGLGSVVCVDVVNGGNNFKAKEDLEEQIAVFMRSVSTLAKQQLKECDSVISIPTDGISYLDFGAKADLIYQGQIAAKKWLAKKE